MTNAMLMLILWGCGEKEGWDTGVDASESTGNGNDGDTNTNGDTDTDTDSSGNTGDPDADPNEDADGDGFAGSEDCDDSDPTTYPNAMEFPGDSVDQDCDGSDAPLNEPGQPFPNPSFDTEADGVPTDWNDLGGGWAWQANGAEIYNVNGSTGVTFESRSGAGALKIWGDYGNAYFGNGESVVYQQFLPTVGWTAANQTVWIDAWAMVHDTDPLQNQAQFMVGIRCLSEYFGTMTVEAEAFSSPLTSDSATNQWTRLWTQVDCPSSTSIVQSIVMFKQTQSGADSIDHGAVFVDDVAFGTL